MNDQTHNFPDTAKLSENLQQIAAMQAIEGNPLSVDQVEMFTMFEAEGWAPEKRLQHIRDRANALATG